MNYILQLFWNPNDTRLRALWRVILHFVLIFAGLQITSAILRPLFSGGESSNDNGPDPIANMIALLLTGLVYVVVTIAAAKFLDRRSFSDYGLGLEHTVAPGPALWPASWRSPDGRNLCF